MWNCCTKLHSKNILIVALHVSTSFNSKSIKVKLYKLKLFADGMFSLTSCSVASLLAVAWYDRHSRATFCFAISLQAFSYIWVLWMPRPQKIANASNRDTSQSVNGDPLSLLINCATPVNEVDVVKATTQIYLYQDVARRCAPAIVHKRQD